MRKQPNVRLLRHFENVILAAPLPVSCGEPSNLLHFRTNHMTGANHPSVQHPVHRMQLFQRGSNPALSLSQLSLSGEHLHLNSYDTQ